MKHVILPDSEVRRLPFYLAMEEWVARNLPDDDYFFSWQVDPTVIFGRNQEIGMEVDMDYCRTNGIQMYRRKSGGGCVFADRSNIMFSYITPSTEVETTFSRYTAMIAGMLRGLGLDASATGRNDVLIGDRKVSGNAFYHIPGHSIVHGTMLYSTDMEHMSRAITPSRSKLDSKQVKSVAGHITTICEHLPDMSLDAFHNYAITCITDGELLLSSGQVKAIEDLSRPYYAPEWIYGRRSAMSHHRSGLVPGAGEISVSIEVSEGRIADIDVSGDFFLLADLDGELLSKLKGARFDRRSVETRLAEVDVSKVIANLPTERFIDLMI